MLNKDKFETLVERQKAFSKICRQYCVKDYEGPECDYGKNCFRCFYDWLNTDVDIHFCYPTMVVQVEYTINDKRTLVRQIVAKEHFPSAMLDKVAGSSLYLCLKEIASQMMDTIRFKGQMEVKDLVITIKGLTDDKENKI